MNNHSLLQGIFPTQWLNLGLQVQLQGDSSPSQPPEKPHIIFRTLISSEDILDHFNSLASNYSMKISSWPIYDCKRLWHTTFGPLSWHPCDIFYHYCHTTTNYPPKLVSFVIYSLLRKYSRKWRNFYQTSLFYSASFSKGHFFPCAFGCSSLQLWIVPNWNKVFGLRTHNSQPVVHISQSGDKSVRHEWSSRRTITIEQREKGAKELLLWWH